VDNPALDGRRQGLQGGRGWKGQQLALPDQHPGEREAPMLNQPSPCRVPDPRLSGSG